MTMQLMPPGDGNHGTINVNGRVYSCALGSTVIAPDSDGYVMLANGWVAASIGGSGTSTNRPTNVKTGSQFHDQTLGKVIVFDGKIWRDPHTAAAV